MNKTKFLEAIEQRQRNGDTAGEAEVRSRYGLWLAQRDRWGLAADQLELAAGLASAENQPHLAAQYRYAMGLILQKNPRLHKRAQHTMRQAADQFAQQADGDNVARSRRHLAVQAAQRSEFVTAIQLIDSALQAEPTDLALRAELHTDRAMYTHLNGQHSDAEADFDRAEQLAEDETLLARIKAMRALWHGKLDEDDPLVQQVRTLLQKTPAQESSLYRAVVALEEGRTQAALKRARKARRSALNSAETTRYLTYLNACIIEALALEKFGRDAQVIETLLTCKNTLERTLGRAAGQQMKRLLNALLPRWGEKRFNLALAAYRSGVGQ